MRLRKSVRIPALYRDASGDEWSRRTPCSRRKSSTSKSLTERPRSWQTRDRLSVISGITRDGRSAFPTDESSINGILAARFPKHLQDIIDERLLVVWDGSPIHRCRAVKDVLEQTQGPIWLERLPGDAPDLNPAEAVWQHLKNVQLVNVCSPDLETHRQELRNAIRRFKRRQTQLIPTFFTNAGL